MLGSGPPSIDDGTFEFEPGAAEDEVLPVLEEPSGEVGIGLTYIVVICPWISVVVIGVAVIPKLPASSAEREEAREPEASVPEKVCVSPSESVAVKTAVFASRREETAFWATGPLTIAVVNIL